MPSLLPASVFDVNCPVTVKNMGLAALETNCQPLFVSLSRLCKLLFFCILQSVPWFNEIVQSLSESVAEHCK